MHLTVILLGLVTCIVSPLCGEYEVLARSISSGCWGYFLVCGARGEL